MNTDVLVTSILQKGSLDDCTLEELQAIAAHYPYFTPVQLLLAEKLKVSNPKLYNEQLQRLSLYINNPLWLDFLLNGYPMRPLIVHEDGNLPESTIENDLKEVGESQTVAPVETTEAVHAVEETTELVSSHEGEIEQQHSAEVAEHFVVTPENISPIDKELSYTDDEAVNAIHASHIVEEKEEYAAASMEEMTEGTSVESNEADETDPPISFPDFKQESSETEITLQPYHTVDYFASQGIKFVPDEQPKDRFAQQLKSFTEWLKAMKRLPVAETIRLPNTDSEKKVQQLADHSVSEGEGDVVTETMAEVWLKQGNKEKAIDIYNKLSLLNPAKSAYFATLAEQLKNS